MTSAESDYYVQSAEMYDLLSEPHWAARRDSVRAALRPLAPLHGNVLDIGAGTGACVQLIAQTLPDADIYAVEPSASMRVGLMTRILLDPDLRRRVTVCAALFQQAPLPQRLEAVVACGCIGYFDREERAELWQRLAAHLVPGGAVLADVMALDRPREFASTRIASAEVGTYRYDPPEQRIARASVVLAPQSLPTLGFDRSRELDSDAQRRQYGLPPRRPLPPRADRFAAAPEAGAAELELQVRVPRNVLVGGSGQRMAERVDGPWRQVEFRQRGAPLQWQVTATRTRQQRVYWRSPAGRPVAVTLQRSALHGDNVPRMRAALEDALAAFEQRFGPYPQAALQVVEIAQFEQDDAHPFPPRGHAIELRDVRFSYEGEATPALDGVSCTIPAGGLTAIVGPSGAGKTTLVQLLARLWDVQEGSIRLGGVDLRDIGTDELHRHIAMVFQDVVLFSGSVLDNIRIGRQDATREQVIAAAQRAQAHDFIVALPDGYDTQLDEGGMSLSGGERQRISIARALLKDAPILLLDEATSSIDASAEAEVQRAITELAQGRTVIAIAHRLHSIRHADRILVLAQGRLVEQGRHGQLLAQGGLYARFWALQQAARSWQVNA